MAIFHQHSTASAKKACKVIGLACGIAFLLLVLFFATNVEKFSPDLLIPCQAGKPVSFHCPQLEDILAKPLRYLGHGAEAVAFVSDDDHYVMKLFLKYDMFKKQGRRWRKVFQRLSGFHFARRSRDLILRRYAQGFDSLPDVTGMLAVHRYRSIKQLPTCTLIDHQGIKHTIDLNDFAFVIQKKARLVSEEEWVSDRTCLDLQFQELFTRIATQGFVSLSNTFNRENFAILEGKAIMIDLGKLEYLPEQAYALEEEKLHERYIKTLDSIAHK